MSNQIWADTYLLYNRKDELIARIGLTRPQTPEIKVTLVTFLPDTKAKNQPFKEVTMKPVSADLKDLEAVHTALRLCALNPDDFLVSVKGVS